MYVVRQFLTEQMAGVVEYLLCRTRNAGSGSVRLDTAFLAATAETAVAGVVNLAVTEFAGKTVMTVQQFAVDDNTRTAPPCRG